MSNTKRQHPDFAVPADFDLSAYAASRQAWEIGNGDHAEILVAFRGDSGQVAQGRQLGDDPPHPLDAALHSLAETHALRRFRVRRRDTFLRWLLSFAGDARPLSPPEAVAEWRTLLTASRDAQRLTSTGGDVA